MHKEKAMATKAAKKTAKSTAGKRAAKKPKAATKRAAKKAPPKAVIGSEAFAAFGKMPNFGKAPDFSKLAKAAKLMTPEQAMEMYKSNARMALDVINAAIEGTARVRKLQFEGEEQARAFGHRAVKHAAEAGSPKELMAAGQGTAREAVEHAMVYWSQMFELIVEVQKRLFKLMETQMADVPGFKETKAAMAMMPDLTQTQNVVRALQGVMTSGGGAMEQMQKVMADFARMSRMPR
jgi:phasin family protein